MVTFHIITLFPESVSAYLDASILGRAQERKKIRVHYYNPRDYTKDKHRRVDRRPYGGGPGMVIEPESVLAASSHALGKKRDAAVLFFSPSGKQFDGAYAKKLAATKKHIILIAGHYEGIDARVVRSLKATSLSVGPYVLSGGEVPAMVVVDAVSRFIPGVLGNAVSLEDARVASPDVYTRPESFVFQGKSYRVPRILLSGHHKKIEEWKRSRK